MKFKRKILFLTTVPFCLATAPHTKLIYTFASTDTLTKLTGNENATLNFSFVPLIEFDYKIVSRLYNHSTNGLLFSNIKEEHITREGITYTVNYPLRYKLTSSGLRFEYEVTYSNKVNTISGVLYPYISRTINALQYKDANYVTENAFIKVESNKVVTGETFNFDNYNEYLSKNVDNSIDFSSIKMYYMHKYDFSYLKAEYRIKDYKNVYPNLRHENDEVVLNMNCVKNGNEISFELNEPLYVKPNSLEMFRFKVHECNKTNKLFIPVNKQKLLEENDSYILIKEAGYSAIDIKLPLTFFFNKKIIGQCYDSDYCISGGIKEWF